MKRRSLSDLERLCQKPDHRQVGNWMARRVSRPLALRVTWVVAPWGVSANMATLAAWAMAVAAAAAFGWGTAWGWGLGAVLLQLWYLLDHVDGQLARLRGTASLDGVQLDYLMHHTTNLLVPIGAGWGLFVRRGEPWWAIGGLAWGTALLLISLRHDACYKAFVQRLKRVRGQLNVIGGTRRPAAQPPVPREPLRRLGWAVRKVCEMHVVVNTLSLVAMGQLVVGDVRLLCGSVYLVLAAAAGMAVALWDVLRSQHEGAVEQEFAQWYRVPSGHTLTFRDGWWAVCPEEDHQDCRAGQGGPAGGEE